MNKKKKNINISNKKKHTHIKKNIKSEFSFAIYFC